METEKVLLVFLIVGGCCVLGVKVEVVDEEGQVIDDFEKLNGLFDESQGGSIGYDDLNSAKWNKTTIKWHLMNRLEGVNGRRQKRIVEKAFAQWAKHSRLKFVKVGDPARADIRLGFYRKNHGDIAPFDGAGGTAAHAFLPFYRDENSGDVHLDSEEKWTIARRRFRQYEPDLMSILIHEIGHSLGLGHSPNPNAVMYRTNLLLSPTRPRKGFRFHGRPAAGPSQCWSIVNGPLEDKNMQTVLYILDSRLDPPALSAIKNHILSNLERSCQVCQIGIALIPTRSGKSPTVTTTNTENDSHFLPSNQITMRDFSAADGGERRQDFRTALKQLQTSCKRNKVCWSQNGSQDCRCNGHVEIRTDGRHLFTKRFMIRLRHLNLRRHMRVPVFVHVSLGNELTTEKAMQLREMKERKIIDLFFTE